MYLSNDSQVWPLCFRSVNHDKGASDEKELNVCMQYSRSATTVRLLVSRPWGKGMGEGGV